MSFTSLTIAVVLGFTSLSVAPAQAVEPAVKCEADKLKTAAKYSACRLKAESKALKKGTDPDYTKCEQKLADVWAKIEAKGGDTCPTTDDVEEVRTLLTTCTALVPGGPPICIDGIQNGEETDIDCGGDACLGCSGDPCGADSACLGDSCDVNLSCGGGGGGGGSCSVNADCGDCSAACSGQTLCDDCDPLLGCMACCNPATCSVVCNTGSCNTTSAENCNYSGSLTCD